MSKRQWIVIIALLVAVVSSLSFLGGLMARPAIIASVFTPINVPTPSCILGPKDTWDKMLQTEEGGWTGNVTYTNYYLNLSVHALGYLLGYGAQVTIENTSDAMLHVSPFYFHGIDSDGRLCDLSAWHWELEKSLRATDLEPGTHVSGRIFIECAEGELAYIVYDDDITSPVMMNIGEIVGCH